MNHFTTKLKFFIYDFKKVSLIVIKIHMAWVGAISNPNLFDDYICCWTIDCTLLKY